MNYLVHPTYVDPATDRLIMTADPLQVTFPVTSAIQPGDASASFNLPATTYINMYTPPPVAPFSGDPSLLVIDITKVPELNEKANRVFDEMSSPLSVPGNELDAIGRVDQENMNPQASSPRGAKRKATSQEEEEENVPVASTKRKKAVLKAKKENKKATEKAESSGSGDKPFKCPHCNFSTKRRFNLNTHLKTHDINRVKEFVCPQCNKGFTRKHDRDRHVVNVHK